MKKVVLLPDGTFVDPDLIVLVRPQGAVSCIMETVAGKAYTVAMPAADLVVKLTGQDAPN